MDTNLLLNYTFVFVSIILIYILVRDAYQYFSPKENFIGLEQFKNCPNKSHLNKHPIYPSHQANSNDKSNMFHPEEEDLDDDDDEYFDCVRECDSQYQKYYNIIKKNESNNKQSNASNENDGKKNYYIIQCPTGISNNKPSQKDINDEIKKLINQKNSENTSQNTEKNNEKQVKISKK